MKWCIGESGTWPALWGKEGWLTTGLVATAVPYDWPYAGACSLKSKDNSDVWLFAAIVLEGAKVVDWNGAG